ncbi:type VI secretion system baseplate subunit TssF [Escherichia coli]|nr:type VI secretion system baseplate subunit TssF [Escherichia coli]NHX15974.1 type VI secretion system baseplate subunit TssF [Escherichia coli]
MEFEERYFREELDYLRQLSKLLATEKPHLARFLAEKDADPDIERLLEGVAFLTGNLRQKIEDEFPELTHGLIKMLWPNYLRPVPAMTLIEYTPDMDKSSVPVLIPRNEQFTTNAGEIRVDEVLPSDAKKEEPPPCTFTLCRDIWLLPVRLEQIENRSTTRNGVINITFSVAPGTDFRTLDLNKLRFWLGNDDNYTRDQLYLWFCEYLQGADLTVGEQHLRLPEFMLKAVGFEPQDAMLPWPKNVHSGYRILQEYFCYPDAFLFFDLCGCPALPDGLQAEFFTLQLRFSRPLPVDIRLRRDSLRLYCAPAINLFIHHAEAITLDNRRADYPLVPSRHYPQHYDVFSVNSVVSQVQDMFRKKDLGRPVSTQAARQWPAFESFSHQMEYSRKREVVYWHHRTKTSLFHRGFDHTLAFIHADGSYPSDESLLSNEVVSVGDFLDMFSHRLTQFVWHIWRKYRYHISFRNGGVDAFSQRMYSLVGLGHRQLRDKLAINHSKMLAYSGILANPGRSPEIICGLVSHCFDLSEVTLQNWQRRKVDIEPDQQNSLGSYSLKNGEKLAGRSVLGNFVLGTRVPDLSGKFQLSITSLTRKQFLSFLPSGENFLPLTMFVSFILRDQLAWDLHLGLAPEQVGAMRLGDNKSALLGWTSFLGTPEERPSVTIRVRS